MRARATDSTWVMRETSHEIERPQDSLAQLATAMDPFSSTTDSVARTITEALDQVAAVQRDARTGDAVVTRAIDSMATLDQALDTEALAAHQSQMVERVLAG